MARLVSLLLSTFLLGNALALASQPMEGPTNVWSLLGLLQVAVWEEVGPDGTDAQRISALAFVEGAEGPEFVASGLGLWRSADGGASWQRLRDMGVDDLTAASGAPGVLYSIDPALGFGRSDDGGATWDFQLVGCIVPEVFAAFAADPETVLLAGRTLLSGCGRIGQACEVFASTDGGRTFRCIQGNLPFGSVADVEVDPRSVDIAYFAARTDVFRTLDGGELWELVQSDLPTSVLAISPRAPSVVWAGTTEGEVWKSPDRGSTWLRTPFPVPEVLPPPRVLSLTFDPWDPDTLYVVLRDTGVYVTRDAGATWEFVGDSLPDVSSALAVDPSLPRRLFAGSDRGVLRLLQVDTSPCVPGEATLCLDQGRFEVQVAWDDFQGGQGVGHARPQTADSGWFWFFDPANVELLVKVIDGRVVNDSFWFFYGSLSNVEYTITVRDTETGEVRVYPNPSGRFASVGDTEAFPVAGEAGSTASLLSSTSKPQIADMPAPDTCEPDTTTLCLQDGRFRVRVQWQDFEGGQGVGHAVPLVGSASDDSGFFWFFHPDNLELVVKVIDGQTVNGNFWFFYGALSNVAYEIEVTDVETGRQAVYANPSGRFASAGDTETFPGPLN